MKSMPANSATGAATIRISSQPPWCAKTTGPSLRPSIPRAVTEQRRAFVGCAPCRFRTDAHDCETDTMLEQVQKTIEAIRPAIQADGGDIFLRGFDEETGVVTVQLVGACVSCPASTVTLKAGVE